MTPDKARRLLDGTTPGPWEVRDDAGLLAVIDVEEEPVAIDLDAQDCALVAAAPTLAAMIANMREEWGVSWDEDPSGNSRDWGFPTRAAAERWEKANRHYGPGRGHAVRRYVTNEEEA